MTDSCFVRNFKTYTDLSPGDEKLLSMLEKEEVEYGARKRVRHLGDVINNLWVVKKGWCFSYVELQNGNRQILDINLPGDVVAIRELAYEKALSAVETLTDCILCPFPRTNLTTIFESSPRLASTLALIAMRHAAMFAERSANLGRRDAIQRLSHLLLELHHRLSRVGEHTLTDFRVPLTHEQLGDAVGLSTVHVSRTLSRMRALGLADVRDQKVHTFDEEALRRESGFNPDYLKISRDWLSDEGAEA